MLELHAPIFPRLTQIGIILGDEMNEAMPRHAHALGIVDGVRRDPNIMHYLGGASLGYNLEHFFSMHNIGGYVSTSTS